MRTLTLDLTLSSDWKPPMVLDHSEFDWRTEYATQGCGVILTALMVLPELAVMNPVMGPLILIVKGMLTDVWNFCQLYVALVATCAVAFTGLFANIPQAQKCFGDIGSSVYSLVRVSFGNGEDILEAEDWVFGSETATVTLYVYVILTMVIIPRWIYPQIDDSIKGIF